MLEILGKEFRSGVSSDDVFYHGNCEIYVVKNISLLLEVMRSNPYTSCFI